MDYFSKRSFNFNILAKNGGNKAENQNLSFNI